MFSSFQDTLEVCLKEEAIELVEPRINVENWAFWAKFSGQEDTEGRGQKFLTGRHYRGGPMQRTPSKVQLCWTSDLPSWTTRSGAPRVSASTRVVRVGSAASLLPSPRDAPGWLPRPGRGAGSAPGPEGGARPLRSRPRLAASRSRPRRAAPAPPARSLDPPSPQPLITSWSGRSLSSGSVVMERVELNYLLSNPPRPQYL